MGVFREVFMEACMADRVVARWEHRWEEGMGHHLEEHRTYKSQHQLFHDRYQNCIFLFHDSDISVLFVR